MQRPTEYKSKAFSQEERDGGIVHTSCSLVVDSLLFLNMFKSLFLKPFVRLVLLRISPEKTSWEEIKGVGKRINADDDSSRCLSVSPYFISLPSLRSSFLLDEIGQRD